MTDRELMQQAFDAMSYGNTAEREAARLALRERLAQPEQALVIDCPRCGHCCSQKDPMPLFDDWNKDWQK